MALGEIARCADINVMSKSTTWTNDKAIAEWLRHTDEKLFPADTVQMRAIIKVEAKEQK